MDNQIIQEFYVIGISVRTSNENGQAAKDIPALWNTFFSEGILDQIPNKIDSNIYCIYTDYESDYTKPYTTILGCKVANLENIPTGMVGKIIAEATYKPFVAKGDKLDETVYKEWTKIWNSNLNRSYTSDFEVYGPKSQQPDNVEVDIYIAVE